MKDRSIIVLCFCLAIALISCKTHNKPTTISLNGEWKITETTNPDAIPSTFSHKIKVPSLVDVATPSFNRIEYTKDTNRYFWYHKTFSVNHSKIDVVELEIKKAKYTALVFVNGKEVALHKEAFISGRYNIKEYLNAKNESNEIVIRIGTKENYPEHLICGDDFEKKTYFPGIYDDVNILLKKYPYIENIQIAPDLNNNKITALIELKHSEPNAIVKLHYAVTEKLSGITVASGKTEKYANCKALSESATICKFDIPMKEYELWSPETPFLYNLEVSTSSHSKSETFGMRTFTIDSLTKKFLLNNKPYYLRGTNVALYRFFEDSLRGELPWNKEWVRKLFIQFKSMNWNSLRFHVGPAPDFWYDLADEIGILIQDEYAIWYGRGGFNASRTKVTSQQLVKDYTKWIRERWNHPSIVIWDAQNETVCNITGIAYEQVRHLDLSNRPWDNGYSAPTRSTDAIEAHPYLFHDFHFSDSKEPEEGILKHILANPRLTYNGPNEQDPHPEGAYYENAVVLNEYGWLWVNRDGSPTTLSDNVYKNIFPEAKTGEQRIELYSRLIATLTEYWRAHQKTSGIQHFAGLTYSRPNEPRGQTSDSFKDVVNLEFHDAFVKYVKPAFSPVALMIDTWEKNYTPSISLDVPLYVINDLDKVWKGKVSLCIYKDDQLIDEFVKNIKASEYNVTTENFNIKIPETKGNYELRAILTLNGEKVISYRDFVVK